MHAPALEPLLQEIDQRIQDHLERNQRLLRCALLREPPGADLLAPDSARRCRLGMWLDREQEQLAAFDEEVVARLDQVHRINDERGHLAGHGYVTGASTPRAGWWRRCAPRRWATSP